MTGAALLRAALVAVALWATGGTAGQAQDFVAGLDRGDRRLVQAALARAGHYDGLIDGAWGARSARSFAAFAAEVAGQATDEDAVLALLMHRYASAWRAEGWQSYPFPDGRQPYPSVMGYVAPFGSLQPLAGGVGFASKTADNAFGLTMLRADEAAMQALHAGAEAAARPGGDLYTLRREALWITGADTAQGRRYIRSQRTGGQWDSLILDMQGWDAGVIMLVAGSVVAGRVQPLDPPAAGPLAAAMARHPHRPPAPRVAVATGLWLGPGSLLVPAPLVADCPALAVDGRTGATVAALDAEAGFAILRPGPDVPPPAAAAVLSEPDTVRRGADLRAVGIGADGNPAELPAAFLTARFSDAARQRIDQTTVRGMTFAPDILIVSTRLPEGTLGWVLTDAAGAVVGVFMDRPAAAPGAGTAAADLPPFPQGLLAASARVRAVGELTLFLIGAGIDFRPRGAGAAGPPPLAAVRCLR